MRPFLLRLALFALLCSFIVALVNLVFVHVVMADSILVRVERQLWSHSGTVRTLILGDSHALRGIDSRALGCSFSYASQGESYTQTFYKLRYLLDNWPGARHLRRVILPVSPHCFSSFRSDRFNNGFYWSRFLDYRELGRRKNQPVRFFTMAMTDRLFPCAGQGKEFFHWFRSRASRRQPLSLINGFGPCTDDYSVHTPAQRRCLGLSAARYHFRGHDPLDPDMVYYYERILQLCVARGLALHLVSFPVTREYYEAALEEPGFDPAPTLLRQLTELLPNVTLHDHITRYLDRSELFMNANHLNARGAALFTATLAREISVSSVAP